MSGRVTVVKVGGNEVEDAAWVARLADAVASRGGWTVLVHGGGREVSALQRVLGAEPEWREGLRVTTDEAMRAVSMVLSGLVNKRIVAALVGAGVDAIGISGEDGGLLRATASQGGAMGRTGTVATVRAELLRDWMGRGIVPVVSPVSRGPDGGALNVNADDAASAIALALEAEELLLVSNIPGVLSGGDVLASVDGDEVERLIESGVASGGMTPKLRAAARAATAAERVRIGGLEMLTDAGAGTRVGAAAAVGA